MADGVPVLEVLSGDLAGRSYPVDEAEFIIGRAQSCDIVIPKRYISREHARIHRDGGEFVIDGLSQANPVTVGSQPVRGYVLHDGDVFELCGIQFRFSKHGRLRERKVAGVAMSDGSRSGQGSLADAPSPDPEAPSPDPDAQKGGSRSQRAGQVVFDVEESDPRDGATSDVNEQTAEIGQKVVDPDDPNYDPFAAVEGAKKKARQVDPAREKLMRALSILGLLGIGLAGVILHRVTQKKEWSTTIYPTAIRVAVDEVQTFEEFWSFEDPPQNRIRTVPGGDPYTWLDNEVVYVEWAVPHTGAKSIFLIRGKSEGESRFYMVFPETRRNVAFDVIVSGEPVHDAWRAKRRQALRQKPARELRQLMKTHSASGERLFEERSVPGKESYHRQAQLELQEATDAALALRELLSAQGTVPLEDQKAIAACEEREAEVQTELEELIKREQAVFLRKTQQGSKDQQVEQLQRLLRLISHECDLEFLRLKLLLEEFYEVRFRGDGSERCTVRKEMG